MTASVHSNAGIVWLTGLPGAGKSTIADAAKARLDHLEVAAWVLDGDRLRAGLNRDLGFTAGDRQENIRRVAEVARLFADAGVVAVVALVSPMAADRATARRIAGPRRFLEVHVHADPALCEARDPKGLYRAARNGLIADLTGVDAPYEAPDQPDLKLDTGTVSIPDAVMRLLALMAERGMLPAGRS